MVRKVDPEVAFFADLFGHPEFQMRGVVRRRDDALCPREDDAREQIILDALRAHKLHSRAAFARELPHIQKRVFAHRGDMVFVHVQRRDRACVRRDFGMQVETILCLKYPHSPRQKPANEPTLHGERDRRHREAVPFDAVHDLEAVARVAHQNQAAVVATRDEGSVSRAIDARDGVFMAIERLQEIKLVRRRRLR